MASRLAGSVQVSRGGETVRPTAEEDVCFNSQYLVSKRLRTSEPYVICVTRVHVDEVRGDHGTDSGSGDPAPISDLLTLA